MAFLKFMTFIVIAITWVPGASAQCECPEARLDDKIEAADLVFRGELRALSEDWVGCSERGRWNYAMEALEIYKGPRDQRINIRSPRPGPESCGIEPERDAEYLVFATRVNEYLEYRTTVCMGTKFATDAEGELRRLGPGEDPVPPSCRAGIAPELIWLFGGVLGWRSRRRRKSGTQ